MNYLPSVVTLLNLLLGSFSLVLSLYNNYRLAAVFILISMVMDAVDGRLARKLNATSDFGKELDSLADMVSFGVAPALLLLGMVPSTYTLSITLWYVFVLACLVYIICGAYRLARFNVLNISDNYIGVPITITGSFVALFALLVPGWSVWFYLALMLLLSYLMVSRLSVPKV